MAGADPGFSSLRYSEPRLYDLAFPADTTGSFCREACRRAPT